MKIVFHTIVSLFLISCFSVSEKHTNSGISDSSQNESGTILEIADTKTSEKKINTSQIGKIYCKIYSTDSIYFVEHIGDQYKPLFKLIDSNLVLRIHSSKKLLDLIEFKNSIIARNEFKKLKDLALKLKENRRLASEYHRIIYKGGVNYIQAGDFIIVKTLLCSMTPIQLELDREFTDSIFHLNDSTDWFRSFCGWGKMEFK